jgi:hypothetical protein
MERTVVDLVLDVGSARPHCDPLGDRPGAPPAVIRHEQHRSIGAHRLQLVRPGRGEPLHVDARLQTPGGVPDLGDSLHHRRVVILQRGGDVDAELVGDDMRWHQRRRREQLRVIGERSVRGERHAGLLLPRQAVHRHDVAVAGAAGGIEPGQPARLRGPCQHHVVTGDRLAVGIHRIVGDLIVQQQGLTTDHRDGAEVVIADNLPIRAVIAETGQDPGECLRCRRPRPADRVGVVGAQRPVDRVVDLLGGALRAGRQDVGRGQQQRQGGHQRAGAKRPGDRHQWAGGTSHLRRRGTRPGYELLWPAPVCHGASAAGCSAYPTVARSGCRSAGPDVPRVPAFRPARQPARRFRPSRPARLRCPLR